ncbi:hypothetical protein IE53DRAFT_386494 [Violaceomyces palustris]|uniref:Uncharacterized protein n=1 Tax=Violaceomyces palustris TaxID=1673888 RepID=A0ACD0NZF5_9BASI|nr:hypothetical protein IE53DRAFT_386494 [Violaceomyces palustris]
MLNVLASIGTIAFGRVAVEEDGDAAIRSPNQPFRFTDLPAELIARISDSIQEESDLLSLAATSVYIRSILHPSKTRWFTLKCGSYHPSLFKHLSDRPAIAESVRTLVLDEWHRNDIPVELSEPGTIRGTAELHGLALITALRKMKNLRKLVYRIPPPTNVDLFWSTLWRSCPNLEDVEVADRSTEPLVGSSMFDFKGLKRFVWYCDASHSASNVPRDSVVRLHQLENALIHYCPDLEELRMNANRAALHAGTLMLKGNWPKLKVLELSGFHADDAIGVVSFFYRHGRLETLELEQKDPNSIFHICIDELSPSCVPLLRDFRGGMESALSILCSRERRIERLGGVEFDTVMLGAERPSNWYSSPIPKALLREISESSHLVELQGSFAMDIYDKSTLAPLFRAACRVQSLSLKCRVRGFLESYLEVFSLLKDLRTLTFPLQELDTLTRPLALGSLWLRCVGSSDTFISALKRKSKMLAETCTKLESICFGGYGGTARIERYEGTLEVSQIHLEEERIKDWWERDVELERSKAFVLARS